MGLFHRPADFLEPFAQGPLHVFGHATDPLLDTPLLGLEPLGKHPLDLLHALHHLLGGSLLMPGFSFQALHVQTEHARLDHRRRHTGRRHRLAGSGRSGARMRDGQLELENTTTVKTSRVRPLPGASRRDCVRRHGGRLRWHGHARQDDRRLGPRLRDHTGVRSMGGLRPWTMLLARTTRLRSVRLRSRPQLRRTTRERLHHPRLGTTMLGSTMLRGDRLRAPGVRQTVSEPRLDAAQAGEHLVELPIHVLVRVVRLRSRSGGPLGMTARRVGVAWWLVGVAHWLVGVAHWRVGVAHGRLPRPRTTRAPMRRASTPGHELQMASRSPRPATAGMLTRTILG